MILVHRLSGDPMHLNADLIETIESTPDTVIVLVDGRRVLVAETPDEVVDRVREFRASLLLTADQLRTSSSRIARLAVVPGPGDAQRVDDSKQESLPVPGLAKADDEHEPQDGGGVDIGFIVGMMIALAAIIAAMFIDGNNLGPLLSLSAIILVFPASVGAALMSFRHTDLRRIPAAIRIALSKSRSDLHVTITRLTHLAEVARRNGMLALEHELTDHDHQFFRRGVELLVDGRDEQVVIETLNIEIAAVDERHRTAISFFKTLAGYAPTFGMIGTIIGLINMLGNLDDPSQLGVGLALALLTTLYGVLLANLVFSPTASRLERLNQAELAVYDITLDGLLTIHRGATPRAVVERLESYLAPTDRIGYDERALQAAELSDAAVEPTEAA